MINIFKQAEDFRQFHEKGYLVRSVDEKMIDELAVIYKKVKPLLFVDTMYFNLLKDSPKNRTVDMEIRHLFASCFEEIFHHYSADLGCFVAKRFKNQWDLGLHQDWTMCDETIAHPILCWVPIQDTNMNNGCMTVFEGSHLPFSNTVRSYYSPSVYISVYDKLFEPYQKILEMKKGEILFFSHALFHGSFVNSSWQNRVTSMISIFAKDIQKTYYYLKDNTYYKVALNKDFHFKYQPHLDKYDLSKELPILEVLTEDQIQKASPESVLKYLRSTR